MAGQQQSGVTICGGAPPELNIRRLQKEDMLLAQTADLPVATGRCFLADGIDLYAAKRMEDLVQSLSL